MDHVNVDSDFRTGCVSVSVSVSVKSRVDTNHNHIAQEHKAVVSDTYATYEVEMGIQCDLPTSCRKRKKAWPQRHNPCRATLRFIMNIVAVLTKSTAAKFLQIFAPLSLVLIMVCSS